MLMIDMESFIILNLQNQIYRYYPDLLALL